MAARKDPAREIRAQTQQVTLLGLKRLEALISEATSSPQQSLIAEAIDLVVFIDEEPRLGAGRKVREVLAVRDFDHAGMRYVVDYL